MKKTKSKTKVKRSKMSVKRGRTPAKGGKKPVQRAKRGGTVRSAKTGRTSLLKKAGSIYAGASEISVTENKIAVTRSVAKSVKGAYMESTTREYHDRTPESERAFREVLYDQDVKKITVKLK